MDQKYFIHLILNLYPIIVKLGENDQLMRKQNCLINRLRFFSFLANFRGQSAFLINTQTLHIRIFMLL